jgi:hypothetical protein
VKEAITAASPVQIGEKALKIGKQRGELFSAY